MPPMTGRVIAGRYALSSPIGRGAMGVVWRARDQLLDREVAVKEVVLSSAIGEDERRNAYQRTLREARTAARLSHRGVVTIYDVAEEDGRPWIVMELVPSRSLDELLTTDGAMTPLRAGRMGQQLLAALAAAHGAGVLHRDVKPSNVLISVDRSGGGWDERAVLTDFGIAQFEGDPRLTATGMVMGSPGFTAPERIRGGDATPASDLWSLGATIYTAVEGRGPYEQRGGAITTMSAIINEDAPVAPSAGRLGPLIAALLRRDPSARPTALAAARLFAEVLPLLPDVPSHPATVRSTYVEPPADSAKAAGDAAAPAGPPAEAGAGVAEAAQEKAAAEAPAAPAKVAADAAAISAAAAVGAAVAAGAAPAPAGARGAADKSAAPAAEAAPAKAEAPAAISFDSGNSAQAPPAGSRVPAAPTPTERSIPAPPPPVPSQQPKPTFTASKQTEQAAPSAWARSPQPVPPQPAPSFSASRPARPTAPADPPTTPEPAYAAPQYASPNGPNASSGSQHGGQGAQYAGPSQDYPDLARQYAPGTGGRPRRRRRGRTILLVVAAVVVAAAAGGGAAYALRSKNDSAKASNTGQTTTNTTNSLAGSVAAFDSPSGTLPNNWNPISVTASTVGTTAGFTVDVPPGWTETQTGLRTYFRAPNGVSFFEVDLTTHTYTNMLTEARYIKSTEVSQGSLPGYHQVRLDSEPMRGTTGGFWAFTWQPAGASVRLRSDDILFIAQTPAGKQSYAIYFRAPNATWNSKWLPLYEKMLRSFQTQPS